MIVHGHLTDTQTRCEHWHGPTDVIAIKFRCCGKYYACYECHAALESHEAQRWGAEELGERAILCGVCKAELSISAYFSCANTCPACGAAFNPGCANHYHLYFAIRPDLMP